MTEQARKFQLGDRVTKIKGSNWTGRVVGFYSTSLTPVGYAVESETEKGSVQIYPEQALRVHDQAAARVTATALEARDARIAELEGALDNIAADHPMIFPPDGPPRTPTDAEGWEYCKRQARAILTKETPPMTDNVIRADFGGAPFPQLADMYEAVWDAVAEAIENCRSGDKLHEALHAVLAARGLEIREVGDA